MNKMIPSELIYTDENGDAVIGKNLKIKGTTKLNGGFKPIHEYKFICDGDDYKLRIYFEQPDADPIGFIGEFGIIGEQPNLCIGQYSLSNGTVAKLNLMYYYGDAKPYFESYDVETNTYTLIDFASKSEVQAKLYTHTLTLTADKSYTLVYQSTKDLAVNSIADLRTIMNVMATSDNVILPLCATDLSGTAVLQVTTALCKIGTANVTAVTDKVTEM